MATEKENGALGKSAPMTFLSPTVDIKAYKKSRGGTGFISMTVPGSVSIYWNYGVKLKESCYEYDKGVIAFFQKRLRNSNRCYQGFLVGPLKLSKC